jgi:hypothetical protein
LVRTSDTVATITIPATAAYDPADTEIITPVIQAAILTTSTEDVNSSAFQIIAEKSLLGVVRNARRGATRAATRDAV